MGLRVTQNSEVPSDLMEKRRPFNPYAIVLPDATTIKTTERRDSVGLSWKIKYNPIQTAFMFCIYYGFFHIIHFSAVPSGDLKPVTAIVIYTLLGILLSLLISLILSRFLGSYYLIINRESVITFHKVFGRRYAEQEIKKTDIALVRSSIELSTEEILIASKQGIISLNNLIKKFNFDGTDFKRMMLDVSDLKAFKNEMLRCNVSTLKLAEKLYMEQFIMKNF